MPFSDDDDEENDNDNDNVENSLVGMENRFRSHIAGNLQHLFEISPVLGILYESWLGQYLNTQNRSTIYNYLGRSQVPDLPPPYDNDNDLIPNVPEINIRTKQ